MSSPIDEKSMIDTNVLTITRPSASRQPSNLSVDILSTIEDIDSTHSLSPIQTTTITNEKSHERESSPFSPFYNPTPTRLSLEARKSESKQNIEVIQSNAYDTDLEACLTPQKTATSGGNVGLLKKKRPVEQECTVWPGQKAMKRKKKAMRIQRGKGAFCGCMAGWNKKTKTWVKILMLLLVVGLAIGVGVGVSRAVGGGVWKNQQNSNSPINSR